MLNENLKYNFPKGHKDPFEKGNENGNYFVYANAHSNLGNELDEFNLNVLGENIPIGYKTVIVCKRLILISKGEVIEKWNEEAELNNDVLRKKPFGKYLVTTNKSYKVFIKNWNSFQESTTIYNSTIDDEYPWAKSWNNINECIKEGIENSIKMKSEVLISSVKESHYWH